MTADDELSARTNVRATTMRNCFMIFGAFALLVLHPGLSGVGVTAGSKRKAEKPKTTVIGTWFRAQKAITFFEGGEFIDHSAVILAASWIAVGKKGVRIATEAFGATANGDLGFGGRLPVLCDVDIAPKRGQGADDAGGEVEESLEIKSCGDVGKRLNLVGKYARMEAGRASLIIGWWVNRRTGRMIRFTSGGDYMDYDTILRWVEKGVAEKEKTKNYTIREEVLSEKEGQPDDDKHAKKFLRKAEIHEKIEPRPDGTRIVDVINVRFGVIREKVEPGAEEPKPVVEVVVDDRGRELMLRRSVNAMEVIDSQGNAFLVDNYDSLSLNLLPGKWMLGDVKDKAKEGKETGKVAVSSGGFGGSSMRICDYVIENQRLTLATCPRPSDNQMLMRVGPN